eukprot:2361142-Rhodomonas_salina.2
MECSLRGASEPPPCLNFEILDGDVLRKACCGDTAGDLKGRIRLEFGSGCGCSKPEALRFPRLRPKRADKNAKVNVRFRYWSVTLTVTAYPGTGQSRLVATRVPGVPDPVLLTRKCCMHIPFPPCLRTGRYKARDPYRDVHLYPGKQKQNEKFARAPV